MMPDFKPNRRQFLEGVGCLPLGAFALKAATVTPAYKYICSPSASTIQVLQQRRDRWIVVQSITSTVPASSALHPSQPVLYVANRIAEYGGLPRGTVEAYSIDRQTGHLAFMERQPLSLSATEPQSLAVSPDGQHLLVAAFGGGVYNVFSLGLDGQLGSITGILKEVGCGSHPAHQASAHPHSLLFDEPGQHVIGSDFGCDRLSVFAIEEGQLVRKSRLELTAGSGPAALTLDSAGSRLSVRNELSRSTSSFAYKNGVIS